MKKIVVLQPYPSGEAPGQRFRYEQYLDFMEEAGWKVMIFSFVSLGAWKIYHVPGQFALKALYIFVGFWSRFFHVLRSWNADYVFIFREAAPIGPPVFEFIISKILRKKIIYDFDDAIWLPNYAAANAKIHRLKAYGKVKWICKWAYKVSCGNDYLANYAEQYNDQVVVNPTTIDTEHHHNPSLYKRPKKERLTIGWTGTLTTAKYLDFLVPILQELEKQFDFDFLVISNEKPNLQLKSLHYIPWSKATEIEDLMRMDVGVMPLTDDEWARGKCGFKALQYMSLGVPAIVSPVGVNTQIVDHEINGWIAESSEDWKQCLQTILDQPEKLKSMQTEARHKIEDHYSVNSNRELFLDLFED